MSNDRLTVIEQDILAQANYQEIIRSKGAVQDYAASIGFELNETDLLTVFTVCTVYAKVFKGGLQNM